MKNKYKNYKKKLKILNNNLINKYKLIKNRKILQIKVNKFTILFKLQILQHKLQISKINL